MQATKQKRIHMKLTRIQALYIAFGLTHGTVEQVATATGCDGDELIQAQPQSKQVCSPYARGISVGRATDQFEFNRKHLFVQERGHLDFWLGVARGVQIEKEEQS